MDLIYLDPPFNSKSVYNLPFPKKTHKDIAPVMAFEDTWRWDSAQDEHLKDLYGSITTRSIAKQIDLVREMERQGVVRGGGGTPQSVLSAYLVNMAVRLLAMRRVLKDTGSLYLHCDPTASHYLKVILDNVFKNRNFRNEIVWCYAPAGRGQKFGFHRKHDVILFYGKSETGIFNRPYGKMDEKTRRTYCHVDSNGREYKKAQNGRRSYLDEQQGRPMPDWWTDIHSFGTATQSRERTGYPTQKPLALLERIIEASSNKRSLVLDPFCGCGTTLHAAEKKERNWIGIDISKFSVGLVSNRLKVHPAVKRCGIDIHGSPLDIAEARALADKDPFEFEKWVCGEIGANAMFKRKDAKGPDRGVDGVIDFSMWHGFGESEKKIDGFAIVQVKGGRVTPDSVRALYATVKQFKATCGVFVCFGKYMKTVENNRQKGGFKDEFGEYPVIQGFSVENLLDGKEPNLPHRRRRDRDLLENQRMFR